MNLFSHCVLTASDEPQAQAFRSLLDRRIRHGLYPREISFHVYPDPPGRVGSGGGTLWALHRLYQDLGIDPSEGLEQADAPSVLLLHAAGESRRLPVFAPEGKLFAPNADPGFLEGYVRCPDKPDEWARAFRSSTRVSLRSLNASTDVLGRRRAAGRRGGGSYGSARADRGGDAARPALHFVPEGQWRAERRAVKADQIVWARSPVRLDLGGGWTDTPPYTNLFGGAVTNVAVDLNGQPPIQVFVRPVAEPVIVFHSIDLGEREIIREADELHAYTDPSARFALPRAACVLLGIGSEHAAGGAGRRPGDLARALQQTGGGFELSMLAAVPKGSGLGTSSVLGGAMLAALFRFFGLEYLPDDLFLSVLELEQMLTTGGGWQDQIGALAGGVKYIETRPGTHPRPLVHQLDPYLFEEPEFRSRMSLYYTGVTLLGAGGGGYALFLSETVAHAHRLRDALAKRSAASEAARLVDLSLSRPGLQVSVS